VQNIAHSLMTKRGMDKSRAIATALGTIKNWASGRGNVRPEVRAAASAALADWEASKARAHATPNKGRTVKLANFNPDEPRTPDGKWSAMDAMKALLAMAEEEEGEDRPYPTVDHKGSWANVAVHGKAVSDADTDSLPGGNTHLREAVLGKSDHAAVNDYVAFDKDTLRINRKLRNGEALDAEEEARNKGLDSVAAKASLSRDADLWRGASLTDDQIAALTPGSVLHDKGYGSAAFSRDVAEYYMHERGHETGKKVLFRIQGRKGAPIIPVRGDETVLPRGTRLHVTHVSHEGEFPVVTVTHAASDPGEEVTLSQPMTFLRAVLDGSSAIDLAVPADIAGSSGPRPEKAHKPKAKDKKPKDNPHGKHQLPPGAVGWKHNWVPVDKNGNPVGPSQKDKSAQEIKDMTGHTDATKAAIAQAYKNKATADAKKASKKAASAKKHHEAEAKRAARAKAAAAKKAAHAKEMAKKKAEVAKLRAQKQAAKEKAAKAKAKQKLISDATRQALADKKAGRPLTPTQVRLLDHYEAQQEEIKDNLRNNVNLSQPMASEQVTVPTGSSQDGARLTVNSLTTKYPKRYLADAAIKAQKKRRQKGKKCL
jgi:hypothetical protein